jgi:hypothetical protein
MPWGDCTGPWWIDPGMKRASGYGCCGRGMRLGRDNAVGQVFAVGDGHFRQPTPAGEKSYLEGVARRLEEELFSVRERMEKLRSGA